MIDSIRVNKNLMSARLTSCQKYWIQGRKVTFGCNEKFYSKFYEIYCKIIRLEKVKGELLFGRETQ